MDAIERRLRVLEDTEAIRALKHRYLACCDGKDPRGVRACFGDGTVDIDYGAVGRFRTADELVALFTSLACHPHIVEMHHGVNPEIQVDGDVASGRWGLHYQQINTRDRMMTQLGGYYEDGYRRTAAGWKIVRTRFVATSTLVAQLGEVAIKPMFFGTAPPAPGG